MSTTKEFHSALDAVLSEDAQRDARPESCDIEPVDAADVMVISGWAATNNYTLDAVWMRGGRCYVALSPRGLGAFDPPDSTVFRFDRATTTMEAVAWEDGTKAQYEYHECSICRQRHKPDDRHSFE